MKLKEAIEETDAAPRTRGELCTIWRALNSLDPDDCERLREYISATVGVIPQFIHNHQQVADVLGKIGWPVTGGTVGRHRSGKCACERR